MKPLPQTARLHLLAAEGWLGLGNLGEATAELEEISPRLRVHPDVLTVRYQIFSAAGNWNACLDIGTAMTKLDPGNPLSWWARAAALGELPHEGPNRNAVKSSGIEAKAYDKNRLLSQLWFTFQILPPG